MIVKVIKAGKAGSGRVLASYVLDLQHEQKGERLGAYALDLKHGGEKVEWARTVNTGVDDPRWAVQAIEQHNAQNTRAHRISRYEHIVVSFAEGERPTREQMAVIEDRLMDKIGFGDHPRVSAVHKPGYQQRTGNNWHLHIAVSRIDPTMLKAEHPRHNHFALQAEAARLEISLGLRQERKNLLSRERQEIDQMRAIDRAVEAQHPDPQHVETIAKIQTPEIDWQALNDRNVAEHVRKRAEASQEIEKHGPAMALGAQPAISSEERAQLEREARLDRMDSGDVATPADIARKISPEYAHAEARLEAVNVQLDRTRWNRGQLHQEAQAALYRIDERRQGMSWWEAIKNIGRTDPELAHWRDVHDRSVAGYHRAARQERALEKEQTRATKDAHKVYDGIKPQAEAELTRRHQTAEVARERLRVIDAPARGVEKLRAEQSRQSKRTEREIRQDAGRDYWQETIKAGRQARVEKARMLITDRGELERLKSDAQADIGPRGGPLTAEEIGKELSATFKAVAEAKDQLAKDAERAADDQRVWTNSLEANQHGEADYRRRLGRLGNTMTDWGIVSDDYIERFRKDAAEAEQKLGELAEQAADRNFQIHANQREYNAEWAKIEPEAKRQLGERQAIGQAARVRLSQHYEASAEVHREQERLQQQQSRGYSLGR